MTTSFHPGMINEIFITWRSLKFAICRGRLALGGLPVCTNVEHSDLSTCTIFDHMSVQVLKTDSDIQVRHSIYLASPRHAATQIPQIRSWAPMIILGCGPLHHCTADPSSYRRCQQINLWRKQTGNGSAPELLAY